MARIHGIAIAPGVSTNGRKYTREALAKAATRLQARLSDPNGRPITMLSHHAAGDDSLRIAGRVTKVSLTPAGAIAYEGVTADTDAGRTIATLAKPGPDGKQFLKNVSIRGAWLGEVRSDDQGHTYGEDLEIDGLDFTKTPGVAQASVTAESGATAESAERTPITESAEEATFMDTTEADKAPYGDVAYADPGYQADKKKRYPIDTAAHVRAAWSYINKGKNGDKYTGAQLKRIKARIKAAAKKCGVDIAQESAATEGQLLEAFVAEAWAAPEVQEAYASLNIYNGQADVNISGRAEPEEIKGLVAKVATAALAALNSLDPDDDGDIDGITDDDEPGDAPAPVLILKTPESADSSAVDGKEGAQVPEENKAGETNNAGGTAAPATITLSQESLSALLSGAVAEGIKIAGAAAPAAPAETAPAAGAPAAETAEQKAAREAAELRESIKAEVRAELVAEEREKGVTRKGIVREAMAAPDFSMGKLEEGVRDDVFEEALLQRFTQLSPALQVALADATDK